MPVSEDRWREGADILALVLVKDQQSQAGGKLPTFGESARYNK